MELPLSHVKREALSCKPANYLVLSAIHFSHTSPAREEDRVIAWIRRILLKQLAYVVLMVMHSFYLVVVADYVRLHEMLVISGASIYHHSVLISIGHVVVDDCASLLQTIYHLLLLFLLLLLGRGCSFL